MGSRALKWHLFRPNDKLKMQDNFLFFDTETTIKKDWRYQEQKLKLGWALHWDRRTGEKTYCYFDKPGKFHDFLESCIIPERPLMVYAHNTDFDFKVVDGFNELVVLRGWETDIIHMEQNIFMLTLKRGKDTVNVLDTMNYSPKSLKDIGKSIGLEKMEIDFQTCSTAELSDYCRNDVDITQLFIEKLIEFLEKNNLTRLKNTAASIALNSFRHRFYDIKNMPIVVHALGSAMALERASYRGGITDLFHNGPCHDRLYKLDFNSMYPSVMHDEEIPVNLIEYDANGCTLQELQEKMNKHAVIARIDLELPQEYAYILTHGTISGAEKCLFLQGQYTETLCGPEIEFVLKHGKIHKIHEYAVYDTAPLFKEYVDFFYQKRKQYKSTVFDGFCKMMLNSLYGKFGQKATTYEEVGYEETCRMAKYCILEEQENGEIIEYTRMQAGHKIYDIRPTERNSFDSFVAIASYITSHARMRLVSALLKAGRENVYYCDTDSLIVNEKGLLNLKDLIDKDKLGFLKVEGESVNNFFIKPKYYIFDGKETIKGVKKSSIRLYDGEKELIILSEQFERFNSALRNGTIDRQRVKKVNKVISKLYDKGHIVDGCIVPYFLDELRETAKDCLSYRQEWNRYGKLQQMLVDSAWVDSSLEAGGENDHYLDLRI